VRQGLEAGGREEKGTGFAANEVPGNKPARAKRMRRLTARFPFAVFRTPKREERIEVTAAGAGRWHPRRGEATLFPSPYQQAYREKPGPSSVVALYHFRKTQWVQQGRGWRESSGIPPVGNGKGDGEWRRSPAPSHHHAVQEGPNSGGQRVEPRGQEVEGRSPQGLRHSEGFRFGGPVFEM